MATRLQCQFESFHGQTYRIDIDDADYVGAATEIDVSEEGFNLRYSGQTDRVVPGIMGSSCSVSIAVTPDNRTTIDTIATAIRNSEETRFSIAMYKVGFSTTTLFWAGTVLTDLGGFDDIGDTFFFTIEAVDGLARLKNIDYKDESLTPDGPYGSLSLLNHLLNCLTTVATTGTYWSGTDVFLRTVVNWRESGHPALAANVCPLKYTRVHGRVFAKERLNAADEDWDFFDMYKVVEKICEHWGARLMLSDGSWRFEQVRERLEETFYERHWDSLDTTGNLLSSTATATYDHNIIQASVTDFRTSGGQFNYLPALHFTEVNYKHNTYVNQLDGQYYRWQKDSSYDQTYTVTGISFDADSYFKVSGVLNFECSTTFADIGDRWRVVFGVLLRLPDQPYRLRSHTSVTQVGPNAPVYTINRENTIWTTTDSGVFYEISSQVITSEKAKFSIPFEFWTPYIPSGQTSFSINFSSQIRGEYIADGSPATLTFTDWFFEDLVMTINGLDTATNYETDRKYRPTNTDTGNSDALKIDAIFGHAVKGWTPCKLQVTNDLSAWTDTTGTWDRGSETSDDEFGELLAKQLLRLQQLPVQTYSGTLVASPVGAHSRIVFDDDTTWLVTRGTFQGAKDQWQVEMLNTGVADANTVIFATPGRLINGPTRPRVTKWGLVAAPSDGTGFDTAGGISTRIGLDTAAVNIVNTTISAGTITSIPVQFTISGGTFNDGDFILIQNPQNGNVVAFEVDGDQAAGSSSVSVVSQVTTVDIPLGSQVFYPLHNVFTQNTGGGGYGGGGTGDINDGGNTTGATITIGTNDANNLAFETNNVTRMTITGGASTGGAVTITNVTANTNTVQDVLTLQSNSTGTAAASFGPGILLQGESSTTDSQDMARLAAIWTTATHASREAKLSIQLGNNAGSLAEIANFNVSGDSAGQLSVGSSSAVTLSNSALTTAQAFTVGGSANQLRIGNSSGVVSVSTTSTSASGITISNNSNTSSTTGGITIGGGTFTQTSGTRNYVLLSYGFAPTSGTAVHNQLAFTGTFNQTGGASGITRGVYLNQTITAVADFRALEIAADGTNVKSIYQSGTTAINNLAGATAIGTTSTPNASAILDIVSTAKGLGLPAMTTAQVNAIGSPRDGLFVYDTDTDTAKLRANGAWVSLGTGSGTVDGSGAAGYVAYWTDSDTLSGESNLYWDATNNRLGIGESSPDRALHIRTNATDPIYLETDGTVDQDCGGIEFVGTATGPYVQRGRIALDVFSKAGASPKGQSLVFRTGTDGQSGGGQMALYENQMSLVYAGNFTFQGIGTGNRLRFESTSGCFSTVTWLLTNSSYTTQDTTARLKLVGIGTTSSNYGLKIHDGGNGAYFYARDDKRIGVGVDPADARVQIMGEGTTTGKALLVESSSGTDNFHVQDSGVCTGQAFQNNSSAPTVSYGAAAGTGPVTDLLQGGQNGVNIFFTTGTSPGASAAVFTVNLPKSFANGCAASFVAYNAATQPLIGNFWLSGTSQNSITISYAGTLAASTAYALSITIFGF